jgi:signal transduction histidine kinase
MLRSLYSRLALALIVLLGLLGVLVAVLVQHFATRYQQEVSQTMNRDLAMYIAEEHRLFRGENLNSRAVEKLFHEVMVVNPAVEVYLLDASGKILAFSAPPEKVRRTSVSLSPVSRFLGGARPPLYGDDPRDPSGQKVFSVAPVGPAATPHGYVYVILGGETFQGIAAMAAGSYVARTGFAILGIIVIAGIGIGLMLFRGLTRRLRNLTHDVEHFRELGARQRIPPPAVAVNDEITRLHQTCAEMSARLDAQMQSLEATDRMRRELVANVSHDLRTPLAAMRGYLETLQIKDAELTLAEKQRYLAIAVSHTERLARLIAELFELARLDAGEVRLKPESFPPAELVQDVAHSFEIAARERAIRLQTDLGANTPPVRADIALIQRALANLLDNALRHTPAGGTVRVSLAAAGNRVRVAVADSGPGIAHDDLPYIFDRFYRGHDDPRAQTDGAGLGLAIVRRILDLHETTIAVESKPGTGARFTFDLPADETVS